MKPFETWIIDYVLNSLWQVPLVFVAAWVAARLASPIGPATQHRVWVLAVMAQVVLPMCHFDISNAWRHFGPWFSALIHFTLGGGGNDAETRVALGPATVVGDGFMHLPGWSQIAIAATYSGLVLYAAGRLMCGLLRTNQILREAQTLPAADELVRSIGRAGATEENRVEVLVSEVLSGPVTIGLRRRALLLPAGFLEQVSQGDLTAVLAHEVAHIDRRDFLKNLFYGALSLPISYHPVLWLTTACLAETREMVCDEIAAQFVTGRENYARSLLRLASMLVVPMPVRTLHAIGIFDANSLERRVMNLTQKRPVIRGVRRFALVAACVVVALGACASALALRLDFTASATETDAPKRPHVGVNDLKIVSKVQPVYPVKAKQEKNTVNGAVILTATIGKDGAIEHLAVKKSLRDDYDQSALDAVRQWRYEPYLLNGEAVEVETEVSIFYEIRK